MVKLPREFELNEKEIDVLTVLAMNQGQGYAKGIAEKMGDKRQSINPIFNKLKDKNLIEPIGKDSNPRIYELTSDGTQALMQVMKTDRRHVPRLLLRTHKIDIRYPINSGYDKLDQEDLDASKTELRNWTRFEAELDSELSYTETIHYQITPGSLVVKIPEIITHCTCDGIAYATLEAQRKAEEVKEIVKDKAPYLKLGRASPVFSDRHYAFEAHPNALMLDQYDIRGVIRAAEKYDLVVDQSKEQAEAEVEGSKSREPAMKLADNLEYQAENRIREEIGELRQELDAVREEVGELK